MRSNVLPAIFAVFALLSSCTPGDRQTKPIRVDLVSSAGCRTAWRAIAEMTRPGLVALDGKGQVVPGLAASWRLTASGSLIFRLRHDVPTGRSVPHSEEVVTSFRRMPRRRDCGADPQMLAFIAAGDRLIGGDAPAGLGVDAPSPDVVEVRPAGSLPALITVLAQPEFGIVGRVPDRVGYGAWRVEDAGKAPLVLVPTVKATTASTVGKIAVEVTTDSGTAIARFVHGRTDVVLADGMAGFDDARLLGSSNTLRVEPTWGVYGYVVRPDGALADVRVRRALAMAIDRDALGSRLFGIALAPVLGLVPPLPSESAPALPDWAIQAPQERVELARQLLAAAGFGPAKLLSVTISLPYGSEHAKIASEVASDWRAIGVQATTVVRSPAAHAAALAAGRYDVALVERMSPLDTAFTFLTPFRCSGNGYCNRGADALVAAARTAANRADAVTTLAAAEATMVADTPMIALFSPIRWALVSPQVGGWYANPGGHHPLGSLHKTDRRAGS